MKIPGMLLFAEYQPLSVGEFAHFYWNFLCLEKVKLSTP